MPRRCSITPRAQILTPGRTQLLRCQAPWMLRACRLSRKRTGSKSSKISSRSPGSASLKLPGPEIVGSIILTSLISMQGSYYPNPDQSHPQTSYYPRGGEEMAECQETFFAHRQRTPTARTSYRVLYDRSLLRGQPLYLHD